VSAPAQATPTSNDMVNAIWKYVAMTAIGIILGGAPAYISLAIDHHAAMTRADVDAEFVSQSGALVQSVSDLKDEITDLRNQVRDTNGKIDELSKLERAK